MITQETQKPLDKYRPAPSLTLPNNGLRLYLALLKDQSWRAVVCATAEQAAAAIGEKPEKIHLTKEYIDIGEEAVWANPGTAFKQQHDPVSWIWVAAGV
jgi:hypothetical protein